MNLIAAIVLLLLYGIAMFTDLKYRLIKNWLTLPAILIGLGFMLYQAEKLYSVPIYLLVLLGLGVLNNFLGFWAFGDTKLFLAGGIWTSVLLNYHHYSLALLLYVGIMFFYVVTGIYYFMKKYRFNLKLIALKMKTKENEHIATVAGAVTIFLGNAAVIGLLLY